MVTLRRLRIWALPLMVVAALIFYAFRPPEVEVDIVAVVEGPLEVIVREDGRTRVRERYVVSTPLEGELLRVGLRPGDRVVAGETLIADIEPGDPALLDVRTRAELEARAQAAEARLQHARTQREKADTTVDFARSQHRRAERLLGEKATSRDEYETAEMLLRTATVDAQAAEFAVNIAEFELQQAQAALSRSVDEGKETDSRLSVHSPISGEVLQVFRESGGLLPAGTPLVELGDRQDMEVEVDVLSHDAVRISPGARVYIEDWGAERPLSARVRLVEPQAFQKVSALGIEEQRVNVIADFEDPFEVRQRLGDAYRVEAGIVVWSADHVLKCSAGAFFRFGGGWAAYRIVDGRAQLTAVEVGHTSGLETEILQGVSPGDQLVAYPGDQIRDGVRVRARINSR